MSSMATEHFSALRPRLFGAAYRMLGSRADAEDVLQDVFPGSGTAWAAARRSDVS